MLHISMLKFNRTEVYIVDNPRFQIRESEQGLKELDEALIKMGYVFGSHDRPDRSRWYHEQKQKLIEAANQKDSYK